MDLLQVENVSKHYAAHTALDDVSLSVPEGSIYGLLGPNGAGKTTLIRIINHITAPDSGKVYLDGHILSPEDIYSIGYLPEERGLYKKMKVGEQALFFARLKGVPRNEAVVELRKWFKKFDIENWWNKKVEELSKGMAQKIQFITTVIHRPKLLIFDEPFSGFDPINANLLKEEIIQLRNEGATVIFSTHNMTSVEELCDHITLINKSHNILSGAVDDVRRQYSENQYRLSFMGDVDKLSNSLLNQANLIEVNNTSNGLQEAKIKIANKGSLRDIITIANHAVELHAINEEIPTMNDIFIQTVNQYNNSEIK